MNSKIIIWLCFFSLVYPEIVMGQTAATDSTLNPAIHSDSDKVFLPISQFTYAGDRRYTITGESPRLSTEIKPLPSAILGGVILTSVIALHINQRNAWWSGTRGSFHFQEDWLSALQVDKTGHAFGGYLFSYGMDEALKTSGVDYNSSAIYGSVLGLVYQTYVESEDGFAKEWGFSPSDWYFDVAGSAFYLAQHYVPALQNITPKWQYIPTEWTSKANIK